MDEMISCSSLFKFKLHVMRVRGRIHIQESVRIYCFGRILVLLATEYRSSVVKFVTKKLPQSVISLSSAERLPLLDTPIDLDNDRSCIQSFPATFEKNFLFLFCHFISIARHIVFNASLERPPLFRCTAMPQQTQLTHNALIFLK